MLPKSFYDMFPKLLQDNDPRGISLAEKLNTIFGDIEKNIIKMLNFFCVEKVPIELIGELNFLLNAGINNGDTERVKRQKIYYAIQTHKKRYLWVTIKKVIDNITLGNASIIPVDLAGLWIMCDDNTYISQNSSRLTDNTDYGMRLFDGGSSANSPGNIYIDVGVSGLPEVDYTNDSIYLNDSSLLNYWATYTNIPTNELGFVYFNGYYFWDKLYNELLKYVPAYMILHLGFFYNGVFQEVITV